MATETEWYAREVKFWTQRLAFGQNVALMDSLWMANRTEHHSKALEKKSDLRMCLVDETQRGIFYLNIIYVNEGMILCRLESSWGQDIIVP